MGEEEGTPFDDGEGEILSSLDSPPVDVDAPRTEELANATELSSEVRKEGTDVVGVGVAVDGVVVDPPK